VIKKEIGETDNEQATSSYCQFLLISEKPINMSEELFSSLNVVLPKCLLEGKK
jgi:hypothetical protein